MRLTLQMNKQELTKALGPRGSKAVLKMYCRTSVWNLTVSTLSTQHKPVHPSALMNESAKRKGLFSSSCALLNSSTALSLQKERSKTAQETSAQGAVCQAEPRALAVYCSGRSASDHDSASWRCACNPGIDPCQKHTYSTLTQEQNLQMRLRGKDTWTRSIFNGNGEAKTMRTRGPKIGKDSENPVLVQSVVSASSQKL